MSVVATVTLSLHDYDNLRERVKELEDARGEVARALKRVYGLDEFELLKKYNQLREVDSHEFMRRNFP